MYKKLKYGLALLFMAAGFFALQAQEYESEFRSALEQEAARNWSAAIQHYLAARRADGSKSFPEDRIKSIFSELLRAGENTQPLRILLPMELDQKFEREGVYSREPVESTNSFSWIGYLVWSLIGGGLLLGLGFLGLTVYYQRSVSPTKARVPSGTARPRYESTSAQSSTSVHRSGGSPPIRSSGSPPIRSAGSPPRPPSVRETSEKPIMTGSVPVPSGLGKPKSSAMTEKSRDEIQEVMSSVSSLTRELKHSKVEKVEESEDEVVQLKESDIVQALAETLISEVKVDETQQGRFSKVSLDASLFFDETDVDFFEKEFGSEDSKI